METTRREYPGSLIHPHKIFSVGVPSPPPWPEQASESHSVPKQMQTSSVSVLQWKPTEQPLIRRALIKLQFILRAVHKRKIVWPVEDTSTSSSQSPNDYMMTLLHPITDIFNQLHSPGVLKEPMECVEIDFGDECQHICAATFVAKDFEKLPKVHPPIVLCLPCDLFDAEGEISSRLEYALSKALALKPSTSYLIVYNLADIVVFSPPPIPAKANSPGHVYERASTTDPSQALRAITTALLIRSLREDCLYINAPKYFPDTAIHLSGPRLDPNAPLLPDEEVFATHHRHSDFDFVSLICDRARRHQFVRWKEYIVQMVSKVVVESGDVLRSVTDGGGTLRVQPDRCPVYPYDPSELPEDTRAHLEAIRRELPLAAAGLANTLKRSETFSLKIDGVVSEGNEYSISTVYRCLITSIDGLPISGSAPPPLCVKLFDDRFQRIGALDDEDETWFDYVLFGEAYVWNEGAVYEKLELVQGTVVPRFYGLHKFALPDGLILCGLLLEFVEGGDLGSQESMKNFDAERIKQMIKSCRHATRVLDVADVCQRDWNTGQILLHTTPTSTPHHQLDHAVFIDFASATQTYDIDEPVLLDNYTGVFRVVMSWAYSAGGDAGVDLVWEGFGEMDEWDPNDFMMRRRREDERSVDIEAPFLFPFVLNEI
ncbi:hypothetical protein BDN70DRAFT_916359 [Pholiota conissans]|uniref:Uncharacterized protein n=1 Tax=Pholiota conissans TaxID=109636 RepID=A0A9P6CZ92_9AGAR|nr:hypothetical protein BDN70DRAFT_916359 [Pholiota conissans]